MYKSRLSIELQDMPLEQEIDTTYPDQSPKRCDAHIGPNDLMWGDFKKTRRHSSGLVVTDQTASHMCGHLSVELYES